MQPALRISSFLAKPGRPFLLASGWLSRLAVACLLELTAGRVKVNLIKGKAASLQSKLVPLHGFALVNPSFTKQWRKAPRLLTIDEAGQALVFKVEQQDAQTEERKDAILLKEMSAFRKIARSDLPEKVVMPANFFEKQRNIWNEQSLYKQMTVTGTFSKLLKNRIHRLFDVKFDD